MMIRGMLRLMAVTALVWVVHLHAATPVWFDDIRETAEVSPEQAETMLRWCAGENAVDLPDLRHDREARIVFLSVSDGASAARVAVAAGRGWSEALLLARAKIEKRSGDRFFKLDVVRRVTAMPREALEYEKGVEGVASAAGEALLPEILAQDLTALSAWSAQPMLYRFDTISSFFDGTSITPLYRGHQTFDDLGDEQILAAVRRAGEYLSRSAGESGRFVYELRPGQARGDDEYNMLRHAGTIYAMMELHERAPEESLLAAARRAIDYLLQTAVKPWKVSGQEVLVVVDGQSEIKLGGNALAMIALIQYTRASGDQQHLDILRKLADWLILTQRPDGKFAVHKQIYPGGQVTEMESNYYPGQAIMALCRLHELDPDPRYVEIAEKAARYLINVRHAALADAELFHDHWLMYGLMELRKHQPDELYAAHVKRLARVILAGQIRTPLWPDWLGGYDRPPRGNPTATRIEGLCAAYPMALADGDAALAGKIRDAAELGARFCLQLQYDPPSAMYYADPQQLWGGFRAGLTDPRIRIDTVQHNVSALLGLLRVRELPAR